MNITTQLLLLCTFLLLFTSCSSTEEFTGFSYDPEGVTVTSDKEITPQHRRTIGIMEEGIWFSNEASGTRLNDFYQVNDTLYRAVIKPENYPINNSPWYGFKAWSDRPQTVWVELAYEHGEHRYYPDLSLDGKNWFSLDRSAYRADTAAGTAQLRLDLGPQPLWVSAQEIFGTEEYNWWASNLAQYPFVKRDTIGYSHESRPIEKLTITQASDTQKHGVVIITSRLHPPEITGQMATLAFLEEITSSSPLASRFRNRFEIIAFPFANPDGADNGHWRHNAGGVDLNRDWSDFKQPETSAIRNYLIQEVKNNPYRKVYYGIDFHSTDENIFYPINRSIDTFPENFTYTLVDSIQQAFPDVAFAVEPFDTSSPITKNWIHKTFGADAVTYEVDDRADRDTLKAVARKAANLMMKLLMEDGDEPS
ncbi:M14 family metallopeptidase [Aliifodinibius sp. S!AR15-10]|uniref:M14 family metallopeptidase n=1 Tax=Aliifodinibius sp. S!AR15-10 TaxID=2950437 RepID=UPI0028614263|nr:M14 family metallopeptidase [Aliifodinibius sp. S!AR15-10]MDR8391240.1 M14 family metallopeptidase [Aliifodinibius sp. S!AR15-10]